MFLKIFAISFSKLEHCLLPQCLILKMSWKQLYHAFLQEISKAEKDATKYIILWKYSLVSFFFFPQFLHFLCLCLLPRIAIFKSPLSCQSGRCYFFLAHPTWQESGRKKLFGFNTVIESGHCVQFCRDVISLECLLNKY